MWLGYGKSSDVAVIKLEGGSGLTPVPLGNSSAVKVDDGVVAMGNANGTGGITTVTGAITGLNQAITASDVGGGESAEHLTGMLQTDADIIQGDSGGPLVSTAGKVIGMDTASSSDVMASQENVGYAIPINSLRRRADACPMPQTRESPATSLPPPPGRSCSARSARARPRRGAWPRAM
jgi:S1-C subfamily serine protease